MPVYPTQPDTAGIFLALASLIFFVWYYRAVQERTRKQAEEKKKRKKGRGKKKPQVYVLKRDRKYPYRFRKRLNDELEGFLIIELTEEDDVE